MPEYQALTRIRTWERIEVLPKVLHRPAKFEVVNSGSEHSHSGKLILDRKASSMLPERSSPSADDVGVPLRGRGQTLFGISQKCLHRRSIQTVLSRGIVLSA